MTRCLSAAGVVLLSLMCASDLHSADLSRYRGFQFGSSVETTVKQASLNVSDLRTIHQRPAVIQELEWRLGSMYPAGSTKADPARDSTLRFLNGRLYQIITTYDRERIEGLSAGDMVDGISAVYGTPTRPQVEVAYHTNYGESAPVLARWEDAEYIHSLVRSGDQSSFALILTFKPLEAQAHTAIAESARLDALEAPQRALDVQKKLEADGRLLMLKARSANLPNFRP